jgi:hypothetical protein
VRQAATDEEKNVREKLLEYVEVLEQHMANKHQAKEEERKRMHESRLANSSALMIEAEGEGEEEEEEGQLDIKALERKYRIRDMPLFIKSVSVLLGVVILFFIHPFVSSIHLNIPWIAILGALMLLVHPRFLPHPLQAPFSYELDFPLLVLYRCVSLRL